MKRQEQTTGVRKWYGSDWLDIQNELIKLLENGLLANKGNLIISGLKRTGTSPNFVFNPGIVLIDGKICTFDGFNTSSATIYLTLDTTQVITRGYLNGNTNEIARLYKAVPTITNPGLGTPHLICDGTNKQRVQLPFLDNGGNLFDIPKTDTVANDTNLLLTSKGLFDYNMIIQQQFANIGTITEFTNTLTPLIPAIV